VVKKIIIIVAAGFVSFGAAFGAAWFTSSAGKGQIAGVIGSVEPDVQGQQLQSRELEPIVDASGQTDAPGSRMQKSMTEKQLENLIYEVRARVSEYENKVKSLSIREERLQLAHDMIKDDMKDLNDLRDELSTTVTQIKTLQENLDKSMVEIAKVEKNNLIAIAATYDKMDSSSAGTILASMSQPGSASDASRFDDPVKILFYMTERTKAKLLAELSNAQPDLAAHYCRMLKRVVEQN